MKQTLIPLEKTKIFFYQKRIDAKVVTLKMNAAEKKQPTKYLPFTKKILFLSKKEKSLLYQNPKLVSPEMLRSMKFS